MVCFPHWFRTDDNDNFDGDSYDNDGGDFIVHEECEADQYTSIGKKGSNQRLEANGQISRRL